MKKTTLRISTFLLFAMFALQVHAQPILWCGDGTYKIGARSTNLFMTINGGSGALEWQTELPGDDPSQVWSIVEHRSPASGGLMEITSNAGGVDWTMCMIAGTDPGQTGDYPAVTLAVEQRLPESNGVGDWSGLDQFQRRKATVDANGDPLSSANGGSNPSGPKNNALFVQLDDGVTNSRFGVIPSAAGDPVQFDGGGIDVIDYHLVALLSASDFDASSIFISNPVNNQLSIKGLTSNVNQVAVYSLLGRKVLTKKLNGEASLNLDTSSLSNGMYLVELTADNGKFTKKIIKQ